MICFWGMMPDFIVGMLLGGIAHWKGVWCVV